MHIYNTHIWCTYMICKDKNLWFHVYDYTYMRITRIWLHVYDFKYMITSIWLQVYDYKYMITHIWLQVYDYTYMITHIWLHIYDYAYVIACIPLWTECDNCRWKLVLDMMPLRLWDPWLVIRSSIWHHACTPSAELAANSAKHILRLPHPPGGLKNTLSNQKSSMTIVTL